jgi:hypothetical protein
MNPNSFDYARYVTDQLFPTPLVLILLLIPLAIAIGMRLAAHLIKTIQGMVMNMPSESTDKSKQADIIEVDGGSPDMVAGFSQDGKLLYVREKSKREPVSFFEPPDTELDYVVGFGDDGELVYASEKPKRKNDEVAE